jgi:hypothetical protein
MVTIHLASSQFSSVFLFLEKLGSPHQLHAKDYQSSQGYNAR